MRLQVNIVGVLIHLLQTCHHQRHAGLPEPRGPPPCWKLQRPASTPTRSAVVGPRRAFLAATKAGLSGSDDALGTGRRCPRDGRTSPTAHCRGRRPARSSGSGRNCLVGRLCSPVHGFLRSLWVEEVRLWGKLWWSEVRAGMSECASWVRPTSDSSYTPNLSQPQILPASSTLAATPEPPVLAPPPLGLIVGSRPLTTLRGGGPPPLPAALADKPYAAHGGADVGPTA